ncbi:MAG: kelch repeat-containing protein [Vicingaceae bacterium]
MRWLLLTYFTCSLLSLNAQTWLQLDDFPGVKRDDGTSFTIDGVVYCGTGVVPFRTLGDFHAFDLNTESWSTVASMPQGEERQYANGFASDSFGYVFGGYDGSFLNDLWRYDPQSDQWQAMTPLPDSERGGAASFVIDSIAYIIGGKTDSLQAIKEVWAYNMNNDSWQRKSDLPFGSRWRSAATSNDSLGYLAFGMDDTLRYCQELYEYNPQTDSWTKLSDFPQGGRNYVKMHWMDGKLLAFGGEDSSNTYLSELWTYDVQLNSWEELSPLPGVGRRGGISFHTQQALYYTTGLTKNNGRLTETWKCVDPTSLSENKWNPELRLYPNPTQSVLNIEHPTLKEFEQWYYELVDSKGHLLKKQRIHGSSTQIQMESLPQGIYLLIIRSDKGSLVKKIVNW